MATVKKLTEKTFEKVTKKLKKIGHFNIIVHDDESASVDVDCPTFELVTTLAAIIASNDGPGQLLRAAFSAAVLNLEEEEKKKKKSAAKKKAAVKKKTASKKK